MMFLSWLVFRIGSAQEVESSTVGFTTAVVNANFGLVCLFSWDGWLIKNRLIDGTCQASGTELE